MTPALTRRQSLALALGCCAVPSWASGMRLTVAAFPAIDAIVREALPAWNKLNPHVPVNVVSRQSADHHVAMTTALSTSAHLPDLMAVEVSYIGRFAQGRGLQDLRVAPYSVQQLQHRVVPYALAQATNGRGEIVGVPTDIGPGTLLYRQDLLDRAGVTHAELTQSWDSYVEAGKRLKAKAGAYLLSHARDLKDIMIRTGIQPGEGLYFNTRNEVLVGTPRFQRAFQLAREVRRHKLDAKVIAWSSDWSEGFRRGTVTTDIRGAWLAGHMNTWIAPTTRGLWRASQLPEAAFAAYGGTFYALPRAGDPARKQVAWALLQLLALDRGLQLQAFKRHDAFPALVETFGDPFFDEPIAFLGGQQARQLWRDAAQRIPQVAVHKQDAFAEEVIDTELDQVLLRGKDIEQALADAERLLRQRATR